MLKLRDMEILLQGRGLTKRFGGLVALNNVDFELQKGEILGLIGPNGSGKTTLFNVITGVYRPDNGAVKYKNNDITGWRSDKICRLGIGRTFQLIHPFTSLNVIENVKVSAIFGRKNPPKMGEIEPWIVEILKTLDLYEKRYKPIDSLTLGDLRNLEFARALAIEPEVLLLDEVLAGLTPVETEALMEKIKIMKKNGITVLMIEHIMKAIMGLSDRLMVLEFGRKIAEGNAREVSKDKRVIEAYLGEEDVT